MEKKKFRLCRTFPNAAQVYTLGSFKRLNKVFVCMESFFMTYL